LINTQTMARGGDRGLLLVTTCAILAVVVTIFLILLSPSSNSNGDGGAPAPAPTPPSADCSWCGDLVSRLDGQSAAVKTRATSCVELASRDFVRGTYIIDVPNTCYTLEEDIAFLPSPDTDFRATRAPYASDPAFVLDFPAAILVRAPGVEIDLNGHTISQSREHYIQQRFFAVVELTTPFIDGQGPADFVDGSDPPVAAAHFTLRNGAIGLSSHHGIHGNGAWSVLIENVDIRDYEVGAVALNGMHDVVLSRVRALGTLTHVPVLGTYSSARFIMPFVHRALGAAQQHHAAAKTRLQNAATRLQQLMDHVFADVVRTGDIDEAAHPEAHALFANPTHLPDGSAGYGFILHAHGVAVNGFECDASDPRHDEMHHIMIADCEVRNTFLHAVEVPVLQEVATGHLQRGPAGDVLRVADLVGTGGAYTGTALSETKLALQNLVNAMGTAAPGTLAIHAVVETWASGQPLALETAVRAGAFRYLRNGDTMFHVNKGAFGIRVGGGHHIAVLRTLVNGVTSTGDASNMNPLPGETPDDAYWTGSHDGGHPAAEPQHGYGGADSVGIAVDAASNTILDAVTIRNVHARLGWSTGFYVFNDAKDTIVGDAAIFNVTAHADPTVKVRAPKQPRAVGIVVTTDAEKPTYLGTLEIDGVEAGRIGMACNELLENTRIDGCASPDTNFYTL
jgi:hypothetical protein